MTAISLLIPLIAMPGVESFEPVNIWCEDGLVAVDVSVGDGAEVVVGRASKLEYTLTDGLGRELLSSATRGQPYLYVPSGADPMLEPVLRGMRQGGERLAFYSAEWFSYGLGGMVPPKTELVLRIKASADAR